MGNKNKSRFLIKVHFPYGIGILWRVGSGALGEGIGWGKGKGLNLLQGGGEASFLEVEVWEESFSVPSPFILLCGCLQGVSFYWVFCQSLKEFVVLLKK